MKQAETIKIERVGIDTLDEENIYYLYEVTTAKDDYLISKTEAEVKEELDKDAFDICNQYDLHERKDFTFEEWQIAKALFNFIWTSENGTNTKMDCAEMADEGLDFAAVIKFVEKFGFDKLGVIDIYDYEDGSDEDNGVEIYWDFCCCFDLKSCNFFRKEK